MRERSKDLRVRRTLTAVRKAFNDLVLTRNYNEISITDLTDKAGINRKTFYLHYSSLDDLVSEIEEEMAKEIRNQCEVVIYGRSGGQCLWYLPDESDERKR